MSRGTSRTVERRVRHLGDGQQGEEQRLGAQPRLSDGRARRRFSGTCSRSAGFVVERPSWDGAARLSSVSLGAILRERQAAGEKLVYMRTVTRNTSRGEVVVHEKGHECTVEQAAAERERRPHARFDDPSCRCYGQTTGLTTDPIARAVLTNDKSVLAPLESAIAAPASIWGEATDTDSGRKYCHLARTYAARVPLLLAARAAPSRRAVRCSRWRPRTRAVIGT